jgi:hypothetical protein
MHTCTAQKNVNKQNTLPTSPNFFVIVFVIVFVFISDWDSTPKSISLHDQQLAPRRRNKLERKKTWSRWFVGLALKRDIVLNPKP